MKPIREYDDRGNLVHWGGNGLEIWWEYNDQGKWIHQKDNLGLERWREYDGKGNCIHDKSNDGEENWYQYDSSGNLVYEKTTKAKRIGTSTMIKVN